MKLPRKITQYIRHQADHWIWTGPTKKDGTPRAFFGGQMVTVTLYLFNRVKQKEARATVRTCSAPRCVNPDHRAANTEVLYSKMSAEELKRMSAEARE